MFVFKDNELNVYDKTILRLKNDPIDHHTRRAVEEEVEQWRYLQQQEKDEPVYELCSYLPEKLPEDLMFGRSQEIKQVKAHIQSESLSVVLISGGPGFGKTTVAKAVAHELARPENGKTVLFCSLLSKKMFHTRVVRHQHSCQRIRNNGSKNGANRFKATSHLSSTMQMVSWNLKIESRS